MAQDLKKMFNDDRELKTGKMPEGHEARFLKKLEKELPAQSINKRFSVWSIAASVVILFGLSFGAYRFFEKPIENIAKKVEDYYVANINLELASVKLTSENKELFDSYIVRLEELNNEYKRLSIELTESGPNELTVSALIDNLKLRLNLLYRLKEQLNELNTSDNHQSTT